MTSRAIPKSPWVTAVTTIITALLCNACCWLPPLVIALSGTGAGFLSFMEPYKPYLIAFTALQLSVGLWLVYRKPKCAPNCGHDHAGTRKLNIRIMWCVVLFVVALNVWDLASHHHHGNSVATRSADTVAAAK